MILENLDSFLNFISEAVLQDRPARLISQVYKSYVYMYVRSRDGHVTIVGRTINIGHEARNGLSGHALAQPAFEAGSHVRQTRDRL